MKNQQRVLLLLLLFMFLADGLNSLLINLGYDFFRISIFIRGLAQLVFLFLIIQNQRRGQILGIIGIFYTLFIVSSLVGLYTLYTLSDYQWLENFIRINKMLFLFITWQVFRQSFQTIEERTRLFKVFEFILFAQSIIIILSFVFDWQIFAAYNRTPTGVLKRFGYQGLIPAQNEVSAFFILAFYYYLSKVVYLRQIDLGLLLVTVAGLMTGTKVALLLPAILAGYLIKWLLGRTSKSRMYLFLTASVIVLSVITIINRDYILIRLTPTINYYNTKLRVEKRSPLSLLMSGRDTKVIEFFNKYYPDYGFWNYLVGGHDLPDFSTETDLVDIFARLGLIGGLAFYFFYLKILLFPPSSFDFMRLLFIGTWLGVSTMSGHIFFSAVNGTYLPIVLIAFSTFQIQRTAKPGQSLIKDASLYGLSPVTESM